MFDLSSRSGSIFIRITVLLAVIAILCGLLFVNLGLVAEFAVDKFTDFRLSSDKWSGTPKSGYVLEGMRVESKTSDIAVTSGKATVKVVSYRRLELDCDLQGVEFAYGNGQGGVGADPDNILEAAFASALEYRKIAFKLLLDGDNIRVSEFQADSENIRVRGDFSLFKDTGRAVLEVEISFSPKMSEHFADFVKQGALTTGSDGWYSTVISYTGPTVLLKALYSISTG